MSASTIPRQQGPDSRFAKIEADLALLKWMMGFVLAVQAATFIKLFVP